MSTPIPGHPPFAWLTPVVLACCCITTFTIRVFSVVRYEAMIHEFDPNVNLRITLRLLSTSLSDVLDWFDDRTWYPLGRAIGGTIFPGLMVTAALFSRFLALLRLPLAPATVCVFIGPFMSAASVLSAYLLGKELHSRRAALFAAFFTGLVPAYISRSVAGAFDNEAVAIWALITTYWLWLRAVRTGSAGAGAAAALLYSYMAASWGGYVFIINLIPLHAAALLLLGRWSPRLHTAYTTFYLIGQLLASRVPYVGLAPLRSSEHAASLVLFVGFQLILLRRALFHVLAPRGLQRATRLVLVLIAIAAAALLLHGPLAAFSGRFLAFLRPSSAARDAPLIASISEHQPTTWASFLLDLHLLTLFVPVGVYVLLGADGESASDAAIFALLFLSCALWFSAVMVRMLLVLAPIVAQVAGVGLADFCAAITRFCRRPAPILLRFAVAATLCIVLAAAMSTFTFHSVWTASEAYSSPTVILSARTRSGGRQNFDDFREAYSWMENNTGDTARVLAWWDYGYQLTQMAQKTVITDNNTWDSDHISKAGAVLALPEPEAFQLCRELDVDYVMVVFGGLVGYTADDVNKLPWIVKIGSEAVPELDEDAFPNDAGIYAIDSTASPALRDSTLFRMAYKDFEQVRISRSVPAGYDRVRRAQFDVPVGLTHFEEVFTSQHWLVRVYRVRRDLSNFVNIDA
jgi:dolichyl-diphosphooligosaccharide--protein glycosyltransferase